ncbi:tripartite tricarboxylate transporter permease [Vibrio splendidus]|nr:tripartite tricarboxylate transporter permease [Vibrio splendidus]
MFVDVLEAASQLFTFDTMMLMAAGTFGGLLAGSVPGFTITMAIVLTLPFTFGMSPIQGLATMISVMVGGLSGGLMSGMLTGIPGTPSSIATTFDGFPLVRKGKPGLALGLGVWASFFGGIFSAVVLVLLAPQLANIGLEFGPWDYFSLVLFALTITASLSNESLVKGLIAGALGLLVACVGTDDLNGVERFTFGTEFLVDGFAFLPVLIGLFAFSQLLGDISDKNKAKEPLMRETGKATKINHIAAIRQVLSSWVNLVRSSVIGVFTGILPAAGSSISNVLAYDQAKKASKDKEQFGKGHPDGIIAPEASNNATAGGSLISMMALGIPGDVVTAVMLGALMVHNIVPSPGFISEQPVLANGIFIAFFIAHFFMVALQSLCLKAFVQVTRVPMYTLASVILLYCSVGVFSLNNLEADIWTLFIFGVVGFVLKGLGFPLAPMILGVVLGHIAEVNFSRALSTDSDLMVFLSRPWSLFFLVLAVFSSCFPAYQKGKRNHAMWATYFIPLMMVSLSVPLFMMGGTVRTIIAVVVVIAGIYNLYKNLNSFKVVKKEVSNA